MKESTWKTLLIVVVGICLSPVLLACVLAWLVYTIFDGVRSMIRTIGWGISDAVEKAKDGYEALRYFVTHDGVELKLVDENDSEEES